MKKLVAIVENDAETLELLSLVLSAEGYTVLGISKFESIQQILSPLPALVILDERLDNILGHEICLSLKVNPKSNDIPVFLLSALNDLEQVAINCHADGFIAKPFDLDELVLRVNKIIARYGSDF